MRIIQDSEDEDDLEIEEVGAAAPERDAPVNHNTAAPQPGEKGTGSTESLKRAIIAAHCAHFQDASSDRQDQSYLSGVPSAADPLARNTTQDVPNSSISLPGHASKRRRTSLDGAVALSTARDTLPVAYEKCHTGQAEDNTNPRVGTTPEKPWDLQGSMRDDWEYHEPMGLFAQTVSSTIPNATATQEQLLAEVLAPGFLDVEPDPDAPKYEPAKSSVPWSDYLKSSVRDTQNPSESTEQPPRLSQNNPSDPTALSSGGILPNELGDTPAAPAEIPLPSPAVEQEALEEAIVGEDQLQSGLDDTAASPPGKKSFVPNSEDDLAALGLPKEQYKPRPSRSRSLKLSMEYPIDYSMRPEKAAKKTRRTRTSGDVETTSTATTPEKVRQICDMGFTPLTTKKALRQHNGDVTHTVDWLIANGIADQDELAAPEPSKSKSKRSSKRDESAQDPPIEAPHGNPAESDSNLSADMNHPAIPDDVPEPAPKVMTAKSPTVVKVVIPRTKKPTTPSKHEEQQGLAPAPSHHVSEAASGKPAKRKEVIDKPESQLEEQSIATTQPPKGKKRGRGRPKKETKTIEPIEEEPSEDKTHKPDESVTVEAPSEDKTHKPEEPVTAEGSLSEYQVNNAEDARPGSIATHTTPEPAPEKKVKHIKEAPSSINTGKTPYRVGLSKRARITPLLRTLKK